MWLDTGHEDWQLATLAAPPPGDSHAEGLLGLLLHSDMFLFTAYTLREVLEKEGQITLVSK